MFSTQRVGGQVLPTQNISAVLLQLLFASVSVLNWQVLILILSCPQEKYEDYSVLLKDEQRCPTELSVVSAGLKILLVYFAGS